MESPKIIIERKIPMSSMSDLPVDTVITSSGLIRQFRQEELSSILAEACIHNEEADLASLFCKSRG